MTTGNINCRKCIYYYITWDNKFPFGCKLYAVKSRNLPSIVVYQSTGKLCESFKEKVKA